MLSILARARSMSARASPSVHLAAFFRISTAARSVSSGVDDSDFCAAGEGIVDFPFFLQSLARVGYQGDMVLHGAYEEGAIRKSAAFLRARLAEADGGRTPV